MRSLNEIGREIKDNNRRLIESMMNETIDEIRRSQRDREMANSIEDRKLAIRQNKNMTSFEKKMAERRLEEEERLSYFTRNKYVPDIEPYLDLKQTYDELMMAIEESDRKTMMELEEMKERRRIEKEKSDIRIKEIRENIRRNNRAYI